MLNTVLASLSEGIAPSTTAYESIATVTVGSGGSSSIDFTSIPSTYTHLQIRLIGRTDRATKMDFYKLQFNSDTGSNYAWHELFGDGAAGAQAGSSATEIRLFRSTAATATSGMFGTSVLDILDYANTNKYKTARSLGGADTNGSTSSDGEVSLTSGLWQNTNAITSIQLKPGGGTNWVQYSSFALYGIKGA